jgi:hypothetical protein
MLESGISRRYTEDIVPINTTLTQNVKNNFLEFVIPASDGVFIDVSKLNLEMKIRMENNDGTQDALSAKSLFVDGLFHKLFTSVSVSLNGTLVQSTELFGVENHLKVVCEMDQRKFENIGDMMLYHTNPRSKHPLFYQDADFDNVNTKYMITKSHAAIIHMRGLLMLNIASLDSYMLDGVNIQIRLGLAPSSQVILGDDATATNHRYNISLCKLWVERIVPTASAMLSLNRAMMSDNTPVEYIYDHTISKTVVFPSGQASITIDNPFNNVIPNKIYVVMIDQRALSGDFTYNPTHYQHNKLSRFSVNINGENISDFNSKFPEESSNAYYNTLSALGLNACYHNLKMRHFVEGRSIFVVDTTSEQNEDTLSIEKTGNVRVTLQCETALTRNSVIILLGYTVGNLSVTTNRRVFSDVLQ